MTTEGADRAGSYDTLDEFAARLHRAEQPPVGRRIGVGPPPRRLVEVATGERVADVVTATPELASAPQQPPTTSARPTLTRSRPSPAARATRPGQPSVAIELRRSKNTSTTLPVPLLDRLMQRRLDDDVAGLPFKVADRLSGAIASLPTDSRLIRAELEHHRNRLNLTSAPGDSSFIPEGRLTFRITPIAEQVTAVIIRNLFNQHGQRIHRQDLFALALIHLLDDPG